MIRIDHKSGLSREWTEGKEHVSSCKTQFNMKGSIEKMYLYEVKMLEKMLK
jgi:hypothetical protein